MKRQGPPKNKKLKAKRVAIPCSYTKASGYVRPEINSEPTKTFNQQTQLRPEASKPAPNKRRHFDGKRYAKALDMLYK